MPEWFLKYRIQIVIGAAIIFVLIFAAFYILGTRTGQQAKVTPTPTSSALPTENPSTISATLTLQPTKSPTPKPTKTPTPQPTRTPTPTQTPTPTPVTFSVTGVTAAVSPTSYSGACPKKFDFTANITTNAAGTVKYKWTRNDGGSGSEQTLVFASAGTQAASPDDWTLGGPGFSYSGWEKIMITTPNTTESNQASFTLTCSP